MMSLELLSNRSPILVPDSLLFEDQIAQRKSKLTKKSSCEKVSNYNISGAFIWNMYMYIVYELN